MCDKKTISKRVTQALSKSPAWSADGHLVLQPEWRPLVPRRWRRLPTERAIYVFGITDAVQYESASQVIYIDSSTNLSRRITQHRSAKTRSALRSLIDAFESSLQIAWWPLPDFHRDWLRGIEAEALWLFEEQFGTIPIGNLDIPNTDAVEYCRGLVELRDWSSVQSSLSISEIGEKTGTIPEVEEREPYSRGITAIAQD